MNYCELCEKDNIKGKAWSSVLAHSSTDVKEKTHWTGTEVTTTSTTKFKYIDTISFFVCEQCIQNINDNVTKAKEIEAKRRPYFVIPLRIFISIMVIGLLGIFLLDSQLNIRNGLDNKIHLLPMCLFIGGGLGVAVACLTYAAFEKPNPLGSAANAEEAAKSRSEAKFRKRKNLNYNPFNLTGYHLYSVSEWNDIISK